MVKADRMNRTIGTGAFSDFSDSIRSYLELNGINNQSMDTDRNSIWARIIKHAVDGRSPAPQKSQSCRSVSIHESPII